MLLRVVDVLKSSNYQGVFQYQTPSGGWKPSTLYTWEDMIEGVKIMATQGIGNSKLFIGEGANFKYGLVNIAAFLGECMSETIQYNACDENNWSNPDTAKMFGGQPYTSSYACGQGRQSYQDYTCSAEDDAIAGGKMRCDVDPDMELRAHTQAEWYGAPPKLFCAPRSKVPMAPKWNWGSPWCPQAGGYGHVDPFPDNVSLDVYFDYVNKGSGCKDYKGIKAGGWDFCKASDEEAVAARDCHSISDTIPDSWCNSNCNSVPSNCPASLCQCDDPPAPPGPPPPPPAGCANSPAPLFGHPDGRTDVEGCCWWGRGVIQTTGVCNFGKLNYYMGSRGRDEGRDVLYPAIDFCKNPGAICEPDSPPELKWIAGFFYWLNSVQSYVDKDGWVFLDKLRNWTDAGMNTADRSYIDAASGIVNRGCYNPPCGGNPLDGADGRNDNFKKVLKAMRSGALLDEADPAWV